ncbi:MAG: TraR/DksA family transcriptional regulator [Leptospiraceae bacterium]|nr:TraR/DksA family transcriptional regulator [Leptospiraceae bacterium]MCB1305658.1 TraR/DksA family transcriptional regulator [Leptospiraceae bacterium]
MDKKKLGKYKEMLLKSKAEILHELELENENIIYNDQGDLVDIADVVINNELMNRLSDMDFEKIKLIDRALEKIDDGSYGVCEGTGKPIPEARLNAIPWTPYTVDYAEQVEKQRKKAAQMELPEKP